MTPEEMHEILKEELTGAWARRMVVKVVIDRAKWDDAEQEARIAMWKAAADWSPDKSLPFREFLHSRAHLRARGYAIDGWATGHPKTQSEVGVPRWSQESGRQLVAQVSATIRAFRQSEGRDPTNKEIAVEVGINPSSVSKVKARIGQPSESFSTHSLDELLEWGTDLFLEAPDLIDSVTLAYHRGEIYQAVDQMPEPARTYCVLRFWHGLTDAEASRELPGWHKHLLYREVKPLLRERLAHLVDA